MEKTIFISANDVYRSLDKSDASDAVCSHKKRLFGCASP